MDDRVRHASSSRSSRILAGDRRVLIALSLLSSDCKECGIDLAARLTSKGQVTIPKAVREALGLGEGDHLVFRVEGRRAVLARTADLLDLAGAVEVPAEKRGVAWDEVRRRTRAARHRHEQ
jgi:antitoxin PrlF